MPYIKQEDRAFYDDCMEAFLERLPEFNPGHLNYMITRLLDYYTACPHGLNYERINALIGVLECAKLELYRRVAAPYEDEKIKENGDVY